MVLKRIFVYMLFRLALLLTRPILMTGLQRRNQTLTFRVYTPLKDIFNSRITCDIAMKLWPSQQNFLRITFRSKPHPFVAFLLLMREWLILKRGQTLHTNYLAFKTTFQFLRSRDMMWPWNSPKCLLGKKNWLMTSFLIFDDVNKIGLWSVNYKPVT